MLERAGWLVVVVMAGLLAGCSSEDEKPAVEIVSFSASPDSIAKGWKSLLSWETKHATKIRILVDDEAILESEKAEGTHEVSPEATTTYRLVATGASGSERVLEATVTVDTGDDRIVPKVSFGAEPARVALGSSTKLGWSTADAIRVVVSEVGGGVLSDTEDVPAAERVFDGAVTVSPSRTTSYGLDAVSVDGEEKRETVEVIVDPVIASFGTEAEGPVFVGTEIELSWETNGADTLEIVADGGLTYEIAEEDRAEGTMRLPVGSSGIFTLRATRGKGEATSVLTIETSEDDTPVITLFNAFPPQLNAGQSTRLVWMVFPGPGGTEPTVTISHEGEELDLSEATVEDGRSFLSVQLSEPGVHTFELTATSGEFHATATASSKVVALAEILSFTASPNPATAGETVTLSWQLRGATSLRFGHLDDGGRFVQERFFTSPSEEDTYEVTPSQSTTYRLVAGNSLTAEVERDLTVEVAQPAGIVSFDAPAGPVQAGDTVTLSWEAEGGSVTLTPFLGPPVEISDTASFVDISASGNRVTLLPCGTDDQWTPEGKALEDGCALVLFPASFRFPFDGVERNALEFYLNGFLSFDLGRNPGDNYQNYDGFPNEDFDFVHLAPFWNDLTIDNNPNPDPALLYAAPGTAGEPMVFQWSQAHINYSAFPTDLNFQVALWPNGAVDFRYGSMTGPDVALPAWLDGLWAMIGFQHADLGHWDALKPWAEGVDGGLAGRSWRYFERTVEGTGSEEFTLDETTIFTLCVDLPDGRQCEQRVVEVE